jgi:hypothetical protein
MIFLKYKESRPGTLVYPTRCVQNENEPTHLCRAGDQRFALRTEEITSQI